MKTINQLLKEDKNTDISEQLKKAVAEEHRRLNKEKYKEQNTKEAHIRDGLGFYYAKRRP